MFQIATSLLDNRRLPTELLIRMHENDPRLRERIARHDNAPPGMKGTVPLWQHSSRAVKLYAEDMRATPEVTRRLLELHAHADPHVSATFAQAYQEAGGEAKDARPTSGAG